MSSALYEGREAELERAFEHEFIPDAYELINVYKLYETDLDDESQPTTESCVASPAAESTQRQSSAADPEFFHSHGQANRAGERPMKPKKREGGTAEQRIDYEVSDVSSVGTRL